MPDILNMVDDDLERTFAATAATPVNLPAELDVKDFQSAVEQPAEFKERCPKCKGRGRFLSFYGRDLGECFTCKGAGFRVFRTSTETRQRNRERAADRKNADRMAYQQSHADEFKWLATRSTRFDFADSMLDAFGRYGSFTDGQLAAIRRCMARDVERTAERAKQDAERAQNAPALDASAIERAFETARGNGIKKPTVRVAEFKFKPAPEHGKNPGAVYVTDRSGGEYLGKILGGKLFASRECNADQASAIVAAASDPAAAAIAYGKQFGQCSICGRELSDPASIERGIGPICADNYGF